METETKKPVYSYNIKLAELVAVQEDNTELISVQFEILKDGEVETTLRHGFPIDTEVDAIENELQGVVDTWGVDAELGEKGLALEKAKAKANATIEKLMGGKKIISDNKSI